MNDSTLVVLHGEPPKVSMVQSCSVRQFLELYGGNDVKKSVQVRRCHVAHSSGCTLRST